jgi:hypothetical protein
MPAGSRAVIVGNTLAPGVPGCRRGDPWLMRPTAGSSWSSMTCAACRRGNWPPCTGALGEAVHRENRRGRQIRYVQRIYAPDEQRCLCLFEAAGPDLVRSVNDIAQFPLARVMVVLSWVPDAISPIGGLDDIGLTSDADRWSTEDR